MIRYRASIVPDTTEIDHIVVGSFPVDRHNTKIEVLFYVVPTIIVVWLVVLALASNTAVWVILTKKPLTSKSLANNGFGNLLKMS